LAQLPDSLLPEAVYEAFKQSALVEDPALKLTTVATLFGALPHANQMTFVLLLGLLHHVSKFSAENKMTPENLGVCFSPTILMPKRVASDPSQLLFEGNQCINHLGWIISNVDKLWPRTPQPKDAIKLHSSLCAPLALPLQHLRSHVDILQRHKANFEAATQPMQPVQPAAKASEGEPEQPKLLLPTVTGFVEKTKSLTRNASSQLPKRTSRPRAAAPSEKPTFTSSVDTDLESIKDTISKVWARVLPEDQLELKKWTYEQVIAQSPVLDLPSIQRAIKASVERVPAAEQSQLRLYLEDLAGQMNTP